MTKCIASMAISACAAFACCAESNWPEFRGPDGQGHSSAVDLPLRWGPSQNVTWVQDIDGHGWSSPVVHEGRIFLTTATTREVDGRPGQSLRTLCLDVERGHVLWDREIFAVNPSSIHKKNSYASPTPVIDGHTLYVHFGPNGTAALDFEGAKIWSRRVEYNAHHGGGGSPVISGDALIFNCDGAADPFVVALDKATGDEMWRTPRPKIDVQQFSFATPLEISVDGRKQIVSPGSSWVCAYDPDDGREIWRAGPWDQWSVVPRPVYGGGIVYATTGFEGPATLLAIRPTGDGDITQSHIAWRHRKSAPHTPSPVLVEGNVYFVSDDGVASCLNAESGKLHWRKRLGGTFSASPLYADGRIYFADEDGRCTIVRAAEEFEKLAVNDLGEQTFASFATVDAALLIRTAGKLYRIETTPK